MSGAKGGLAQGPDGKPVRDASAGALRRDLEASLQSLGVDYVDLYQVHWPDPVTPLAETAEALDPERGRSSRQDDAVSGPQERRRRPRGQPS